MILVADVRSDGKHVTTYQLLPATCQNSPPGHFSKRLPAIFPSHFSLEKWFLQAIFPWRNGCILENPIIRAAARHFSKRLPAISPNHFRPFLQATSGHFSKPAPPPFRFPKRHLLLRPASSLQPGSPQSQFPFRGMQGSFTKELLKNCLCLRGAGFPMIGSLLHFRTLPGH